MEEQGKDKEELKFEFGDCNCGKKKQQLIADEVERVIFNNLTRKPNGQISKSKKISVDQIINAKKTMDLAGVSVLEPKWFKELMEAKLFKVW